jgi:hypothetical protein
MADKWDYRTWEFETTQPVRRFQSLVCQLKNGPPIFRLLNARTRPGNA